MSTGGDSLDRTNATADQMVPRRAAADSLKYGRLGYGAVLGGGEFRDAPAFGFGNRWELDHLGIDLSFVNLLVANLLSRAWARDPGPLGISGSWVRGMGLWFFDPMANHTAYAGLGISWGGTLAEGNGTYYSGSGLQGEVSVGFESLRATTIRTFFELTTTLPFYLATQKDKSLYTPTLVMSFGFAHGSNNTVRVVK